MFVNDLLANNQGTFLARIIDDYSRSKEKGEVLRYKDYGN
ncbi:hypothetical protein AVDCRST_MAG92-3163 [uncultured Coleofasciculus sp.]|uniref:Uncharacterized protein n=1 Tax=uncultured Coleofasciculus sp. TaxID=1267456 RepID=A0A6J4JDN7_9CYAN|nr:hypothetical protein AVDCRST_MAG92-3163 [uncultured Coleofasciculus sp.]